MRQSAREYLAHVLTACDGNVSRAARVAKINRTYFYKLLARYGVQLKTRKRGRWEEFGL